MDDVKKLFRQNQFFGGYSDDEFLGIVGSFWRAKGLDIRNRPRLLRLQKGLFEMSAGTITLEVQSYCVLSNGYKLIGVISGGDGKIYYSAGGSTSWTLGYTHVGVGSIQGMCEFNGYFYWATAGASPALHRTALSDIPGFAAVSLGYKSLSTTVHNYHIPMIEAFNKLYIGTMNKIDELDSLGTLTTAKLTLASTDIVQNITFSGTLMKFYCRQSANDVDYGKVYFWNGVSGSYNEVTLLDGKFQCATTMKGKDYFIAGLNPFLYELQGLTPVELCKIPARDSSYTYTVPNYVEFSPTAMTNLNGTIYFGTGVAVSIGGVGAHYIEKGVWSYGRLNNKYPYSLTLEWASADYANKMHEVNAVFAAQGVLHVQSRSSSPTYHGWQLDLDDFQADGEIETRIYDANEGWQIKRALRLLLAFYPLADGEKIEVFARQNLESSYGSAIMTAAYSDTADRDVTYKHFTEVFDEQENNQLQFKIKLTAGTSTNTSPTLTDFAMLFEDIKET